MRELHNRSLHQPGIASGYSVSGQKGDRIVVVGPGYALDADGHEIVLVSDEQVPVPPVSGEDDGEPATYDLVVSYADDDELEEAQTRAGLCRSSGTVRLREEPRFCWVRLSEQDDGSFVPLESSHQERIESGELVRLARIEVLECKLQALDASVRRNARPPTYAHLACGTSDVEWRIVALSPLVLAASVNTVSAKFATAPHYLLRLEGPRLLDLSALSEGRALAARRGIRTGTLEPRRGSAQVWADGSLSIERSSASGIDVACAVLSPYFERALDGIELAEERVLALAKLFSRLWRVQWVGIE